MKASITISQGDIEQAIKEYVQRRGWTLDGPIRLTHSVDDDRGMSLTSYTATMDVSPGRALHP